MLVGNSKSVLVYYEIANKEFKMNLKTESNIKEEIIKLIKKANFYRSSRGIEPNIEIMDPYRIDGSIAVDFESIKNDERLVFRYSEKILAASSSYWDEAYLHQLKINFQNQNSIDTLLEPFNFQSLDYRLSDNAQKVINILSDLDETFLFQKYEDIINEHRDKEKEKKIYYHYLLYHR